MIEDHEETEIVRKRSASQEHRRPQLQHLAVLAAHGDVLPGGVHRADRRRRAEEGDATGVVSLSALSLTPPSLLKMRRMSPSAVMRKLPTLRSRELPFENVMLLHSKPLLDSSPASPSLASPLCTSL